MGLTMLDRLNTYSWAISTWA